LKNQAVDDKPSVSQAATGALKPLLLFDRSLSKEIGPEFVPLLVKVVREKPTDSKRIAVGVIKAVAKNSYEVIVLQPIIRTSKNKKQKTKSKKQKTKNKRQKTKKIVTATDSQPNVFQVESVFSVKRTQKGIIVRAARKGSRESMVQPRMAVKVPFPPPLHL